MQVCLVPTHLIIIRPTKSLTPFSIGRPLYAELSPVTDFREACCRQNENGECNRGGFCNFMHLRLASKPLLSELKAGQRLERRLNPDLAGAGDSGGWVPPSEREKKNGKPATDGGSSTRRRSASPHSRSSRDRDVDKYDRRR